MSHAHEFMGSSLRTELSHKRLVHLMKNAVEITYYLQLMFFY